MRAQIYVVLKQAFNQDTEHKNWTVLKESGMLYGFLVNCETDEKLLKSLEWMANVGHYAEVKMLSDDEPWPSRDQWIKEMLDGQ